MPRLTKTAIDQLRHDGRQTRQMLWDSEVTGFGVRVYPSGRKTFVFRYELHGRRPTKRIGRYGEVTLDQAREQARSLRTRVLAGEDIAAKRPPKATVGDLWEVYWDRHGKRKKSGEQDKYLAKAFILPAWGRKIALSISYADAIRLHESVAEGTFKRTSSFEGAKGGPYVANRVLALVSKMWAVAEKRHIVPPGTPNPARGIEKAPETRRKRYLTPDELARLGEVLRKEQDPAVRAIFCAYLLTGCRKSEIRYARWDELTTTQTPRGEITLFQIPAARSKNGKAKALPLPAVLAQMISALPRRAGSKLIFAGRCRDGSLHVDTLWQRIRREAKIEDVRVHDLRHTAISYMVQGGVSLPVAGEVAGHSDPKVTFGYAHHALGPVDDALGVLSGALAPHLLGE